MRLQVQLIFKRLKDIGLLKYTVQPYFIKGKGDVSQKITEHMARIKDKTLQAIAPCHATDRRIAIHATLQLLDALVSQLSSEHNLTVFFHAK